MATQNLGTLLVTLNADSKAFLQGMATASERIEGFAKETKKLANEISGLATTLVGLGGAAVALASTVDTKTAASVTRLKKSTELLAVQVADILRPAVDQLAATFRSAAQYVAALDPQLKKQIGTFAVYVAQAAVAAKVIGTTASLVDGVAGAAAASTKALGAMGVGGLSSFNMMNRSLGTVGGIASATFAGMKSGALAFGRGMETAIKAMGYSLEALFLGVSASSAATGTKILDVFRGLPAKIGGAFTNLGATMAGAWSGMVSFLSGPVVGTLLTVALVIGSILLAVGLLHRAWVKNWGGIQEVTQQVIDWFNKAIASTGNFFRDVWNGMIDIVQAWVNRLLLGLDLLEAITKRDFGAKGFREGFNGLFKDLRSGQFFANSVNFAKDVAGEVGDVITEGFNTIKDAAMNALGMGKKAASTGAAPRAPQGKAKFSGADLDEIRREATEWLEQDDARRKALAESMTSALLDRSMRSGGLQRDGEKNAAASRDRMLSAWSTGNTSGLNKAERKDFGAQKQAVISDAVGADSWAKAQGKLREGLKGAWTFGSELAAWGARMGPMVAGMGKQLLGAVGDLVGSIVEGAQQGGVWGAIIAAFMEIAKKTASALAFLDTAMEFIEQIAAMVEPLVKPIFDALTNVLGIVVQIVEPIFAALVPLFEAIGKFVDKLAPILYAVGDVLMALAPIIEVIGRVVGVVLDALGPVIDLVAGILKVVATVLLGLIIAANEIAAALGDRAAREEADRLKGVIDRMWSRTNDLAQAQGQAAGETLRNAAAQSKAADQASALSESLSNIPSGYKIAAMQYGAFDPGYAGASGALGASGGTTPRTATQSTTTVINGDVIVNTSQMSDAEKLAEELEKKKERLRAQRRGSYSDEEDY